MRSLTTGAALVIAAFVCDAQTDAQASWCAIYQTGGTNCDFANHAQCMAAASGNGGFCNEIRDGRAASTATTRAHRERPTHDQAAAVAQAPAYPSGISIGIGIGGGGSGRGHGGRHGGQTPQDFQTKATGATNKLPPGLQ
jgi:hypothetical protein